MKKLLSFPTHKLIIWTSVPLLIYLSLYELWWTNSNNPSCCWMVFKAGVIASKIAYSILAASIFYLVTQYLGIYLPRQKKKLKIILPYVHRQTVTLDTILSTLKFNLNIHGNDFKNSEAFRRILKDIEVDKPVGEFSDWHQYLYHMKFQILDVIRGIYFYSEYLTEDYLHEIVLIEERLMSTITFVGYKKLACTDLSYGELDIQEILVHNLHLQTIRQSETKKYEKEFKASGQEYRQKYYSNDPQ